MPTPDEVDLQKTTGFLTETDEAMRLAEILLYQPQDLYTKSVGCRIPLPRWSGPKLLGPYGMLNEVLSCISHHLAEDISLEKLARVAGYSPVHLHRPSRAELQEPLGQFVRRQRMETAAYLLALPALPVWEVKTLVGYQNDSAFGRANRMKWWQWSGSSWRTGGFIAAGESAIRLRNSGRWTLTF